MAGQKIIFIDFERCSNCRACEATCSLVQEKRINPEISRVHIVKWERAGIYIPVLCQQCYTPMCKEVCPVKAIEVAENGAIRIDYDVCIGCKLCFTACPFGAIIVDAKNRRVLACSLCDGEPDCVKACYREAIQYVIPTEAMLRKKQEAIRRMTELASKLTLPQR